MPRAYFNHGYAQIMMHLTNHPDLDIPEDKVMPDGFPLGRWLKEVRTGLQNHAFDEKQTARLETLGISYEEKEQTWESMYRMALEYFTRNGNVCMRPGYCTEDGVMLGAWLDRQRRYYMDLSEEQKEKLGVLGVE
ncbi:MAG: helicase associated domain-containing protein [Lachnospiraceae bacterium]|nr:helicase associated domain-containing protein [Lachnospiraceae bacterium]MBP3595265.1 helicase associated domain-containing protein [Lachnospiraceae bacterium]